MVPDLSDIFHILDASCKGYLTSEQLMSFYSTLFYNDIARDQVDAGIEQICGPSSKGRVPKDNFVQVVQELDRRKCLEEKVSWDFRALDVRGANRILLEDALLLFRTTHGEAFSMHTWRKFLKSRENSGNDDVSFHEIRLWLCNLPEGEPCSSNEFTSEESDLKKQKYQQDEKDLSNIKVLQEDENTRAAKAKESDDYCDNTRRQAIRKQNKWNHEGVEAMLKDDGIDRHGGDVTKRLRNTVSVNEVLDLLERKYDIIREKLFWEMIKGQLGPTLWSSMSENEHMEKFHSLQIHERRLRKDNQLKSGARSLFGASTNKNESVLALMGDILSEHLNKQGSEDMEKQYTDNMSSTRNSSEILIDLHERFAKEKDYLLSQLHSRNTSGKKMTLQQLLAEYCRLIKQELALKEESEFKFSVVAVGLIERPQKINIKGFAADHKRQQALATHRLHSRKGNKPKLSSSDIGALNTQQQGPVDLHVDIVNELQKIHFYEREIMAEFLQGKQNSSAAKLKAKNMSSEDREKELAFLRNQRNHWRESMHDLKMAQRKRHQDILQQGVGLYYEELRLTREAANQSTEVVLLSSMIMADLQLKQDIEFEQCLSDMANMDIAQLTSLLKNQRQDRLNECFDDIASLILGTFECSDEEKQYMTALDEKYEALRNKLIVQSLMMEYGEQWFKMHTKEQQKEFLRKKNEEKKLRHEGKFEQMSKFLGPNLKDVRLYQLMGENREEHRKRMNKQHQLEADAIMNNEPLTVDLDENQPIYKKPPNILVDLQQRYFIEQHALVTWLRGDARMLSPRQQQMMILDIHREVRVTDSEENFISAATSVGLVERYKELVEKRHPADCKRSETLARERIELRQSRVLAKRPFRKPIIENTTPPKGDHLAWGKSFIHEMDKKHIEEREILLSIVMDENFIELIEVAQAMLDDEKQQRLVELQRKKRNLNLQRKDDREQNVMILEEAAAIRCVCKRCNTKLTIEQVSHSLLVDLQLEQDMEATTTLLVLPQKDEDDLRAGHGLEINARKQEAYDNVMKILTKYEGSADDNELIEALQKKYDCLKDKMMMEALMKQLGDDEWNRLSEKERQQRLLQLKLEEKRLRREGKFDELQKLLGDSFKMDADLRKLMGDSRSDYNRKLQERLARRKKNKEQGIEDDDSGIDESDAISTSDPLSQLQHRFEDEKRALLARLRGIDDDYLNEKQRQAELLRIRREQKRASREDNFEDAARLIGLSERNQLAAEERLKNDRQRQEELAKRRLEALRRKRSEKSDEPLKVTSGSRNQMMDAIANLLDKKHEKELEKFNQLLSNEDNTDLKLQASGWTEDERVEKLTQLKSSCDVTGKRTEKQVWQTLQDGTIVKKESRHSKLVRTSSEGSDITEVDVCVSLMADLQEVQDGEAADLLASLAEKDDSDLIKLQEQLIEETSTNKNISHVVFDFKDAANQDTLLEALEGKYNVLRDKLLMEALMKQHSEAEWQNMSERERQKKLMELKLKERKLKKEGKMDEAAALLESVLKDHETLNALLGENKADYERRLKERIERKKQRLAEGMTEEEAERLEKEEIKAEEEEDRKRRKNVLLDLDHRYEQDKEALLNNLIGQDGRFRSERERQAELARLRREQRKARQEDKFDAAALVLGLSEEHDRRKEEDRQRQERLARERLEARKKLKSRKEQDSTDIPLPDDDNDTDALQEAVIKEMERKFAAERDLLLQLLNDEANNEHRHQATYSSNVDRLDKIAELNQYRTELRNGGFNSAEQLDIFKESVPYSIEAKLFDLKATRPESTDQDAQVVLLADLQIQQDREGSQLMADITHKKAQTLKQIKMVQNLAFKNGWNDNVAQTLLGTLPTGTEDEKTQDELVKALESKYDSIRDKLLMEALMKQQGEAEWALLSEKERQSKLIKLKLQEKKLRQEGKLDEAAALLGELLENQSELQRKLGDTKAEQKLRLQERLKRKKALKAEREKAGLSTDASIIDTILDQEEIEEAKQKRRSILDNLEMHLEEEKAALLASLQGQDDRLEKERLRQLQLAKLKRQQRQLQNEHKFDAAALLINMATQSEKNIEAGVASERQRQKQLAMERLAARKQQKQDRNEQSQAEIEERLKLEEAERELKEMMDSSNTAADESFLLKEDILDEVEKKHLGERDIMMELIQYATEDQDLMNSTGSKSEDELKKELKLIEKERGEWRIKMRENAQARAQDPTSEEKQAYWTFVAKSRTEQFKLLTKAVGYRLNIEMQHLKKQQPDLAVDKMLEEISISLIADLQQKQTAENNALDTIMSEKGDDVLEKVRQAQRTARSEGWMDNLTSTLFCVPTAGEAIDLPDEEQLNQELDDQFEKEKVELLEKKKREAKAGEPFDAEAILKELEQQQNAKRETMNAALERQKKLAMAKLEARRNARDNKQYESDAVTAMILMAEKQTEAREEQGHQEKGRQSDLMQQKLAARREARRQKEEEERRRQLLPDSAMSSRPSSTASRLSRERTVIDMSQSDIDKKIDQLRSQQESAQRRKEEDQRRQEEKLKAKKEASRQRKQNKASEVMEMAERNKAALENVQRMEMTRQRTMIQERKERVKERTMTVRTRGHIPETDEVKTDEQMQQFAKDLQRRFTLEQEAVSKGLKATNIAEEDDDAILPMTDLFEKKESHSTATGKVLSEKDKMNALLERRKSRKQSLQKSKNQDGDV